jgi:protein SCO1/2
MVAGPFSSGARLDGEELFPMFSYRYFVLAMVVVSLVSSRQPAQAHTLADLEEVLGKQELYVELTNRPAPEFALQDSAGHQVRLNDFRGKVVILNFIYASCKEACPLQSDVIALVQRAVNDGPARDKVQFVTITTDPERDSPEVLEAHGRTHFLEPVNWVFLTSGPAKPNETRALGERYGLKFTLVADGDFIHGVVTHVIDQNGLLRARFHGLKFDPANFVDYVVGLSTGDYDGAERLLKSRETTRTTSQPIDSASPFLERWLPLLMGLAAGVPVTILLVWRIHHRQRGDRRP